MKKINKFIKTMFVGRDKVNPWLMFLFGVSTLIIIFTNLIWVNTTEFFKLGSELGSIANNFAIGFVAAFIFYLIDIWWPRIESRKKYYRLIERPLNRIESNLESPIKELIKDYLGEDIKDILKLDDETIVKAFNARKLDIDKGHIYDIRSDSILNYIESLNHSVLDIESSIKDINDIQYYDESLNEILTDIKYSKYNDVIKLLMMSYMSGQGTRLGGEHKYILDNKVNYKKLKEFRETIPKSTS